MLLFITKPEFDLRAITTIGLHAKPGSTNPIGKFGSGLKYGIAVVMRLGGQVKLHTPARSYSFSTKDTTFRGKPVTEIWLDHASGEAERLPFTTHLGEHWTDLMAFREFESNTRDEGGRTIHVVKPIEAMAHLDAARAAGETVLAIEGLDAAWYNKDEMFIPAGYPVLWSDGVLEVMPRRGKNVYLKGVKVLEHDKPMHFSYNIIDPEAFGCRLTEDRTIDGWSFNRNAGRFLRHCANIDVLAKCIKPGHDHAEYGFDFDWYTPISEPSALRQFASVIQDYSERVNPSARNAAKRLDIELVGKNLLPSEKAKLDSAIDTGQRLFDFDFNEYPIIVVDDLGTDVLGLARKSKIYLAHAALLRSEFDLISTLLEEYVHLRFEVTDCSRKMQQLLFNKWIEAAALNRGIGLERSTAEDDPDGSGSIKVRQP